MHAVVPAWYIVNNRFAIDYVPILSTIAVVVEVVRRVLFGRPTEAQLTTSPYYSHLQYKSASRMAVLLLPIGFLFVAIYDFANRDKFHTPIRVDPKNAEQAICQGELNFADLPESLKLDRSFVINTLKTNPNLYVQIDDRFKVKEFVWDAMSQGCEIYAFLSDELKADQQVRIMHDAVAALARGGGKQRVLRLRSPSADEDKKNE